MGRLLLMVRPSSPVRAREGEAFPELLQRLDAAMCKALYEGVVTNEIDGTLPSGPSSIRKKR